MILARGLALALVGVVIGLSASLVLARFLRSLLYGVRPTDPLTFLVVALILLCVAFRASSSATGDEGGSDGGTEVRLRTSNTLQLNPFLVDHPEALPDGSLSFEGKLIVQTDSKSTVSSHRVCSFAE